MIVRNSLRSVGLALAALSLAACATQPQRVSSTPASSRSVQTSAATIYNYSVACRVRADLLNAMIARYDRQGGASTLRSAQARADVLQIADFVRDRSNLWVTRSARLLGYGPQRRRDDYQAELSRMTVTARRTGAADRFIRDVADCRRRFGEFDRAGLGS